MVKQRRRRALAGERKSSCNRSETDNNVSLVIELAKDSAPLIHRKRETRRRKNHSISLLFFLVFLSLASLLPFFAYPLGDGSVKAACSCGQRSSQQQRAVLRRAGREYAVDAERKAWATRAGAAANDGEKISNYKEAYNNIFIQFRSSLVNCSQCADGPKPALSPRTERAGTKSATIVAILCIRM